ncbi:hypothetical protein ACJIZ3_013697 [Penstemon smallii]|uniref:Uncharacterized protein n=1 Tax=Penstemon smallii TaxID=265156 RepID=A0ABD3RI70_9LAMI
MAEGLIVSTASSSSVVERLKIAEEYLKDLAERSLVIIAENDQVSATRRINSCRIHDLVRDFCILQGKREDSFEIVDFTKGIERSSLTSRIAVYLDDYIHADVDDTTSYIPEDNHIRSLIFFGKDKSPSKSTWPEEVADLKDFQWTRVLNFDGVDFRGANNNKLLPKNIDKLLYLRYLGFRGCYLEKLALSFTNFLYLETLDLRVTSSSKMIIPNVLWKLSNLLHLYFPVSFQSGDQNKLIKLDGLTRLEILENFRVGICDVDDFQQFKRLQIFTVLYRDGNTLDMNKIMEFINGNGYLSHTSLTLEKFDCYSKARRSLLVNVLTSNAIHCLHLEGHLKRMPKDLMIIGQNFTKMVFDGCEFLEDPMPILGGVKQLMTLVLCNDAIEGDEIVFPEYGFEELRSLKIANLQYLENLVLLDSAAMPNLSILTIEQCGKLEELPDEVMDIPTLAELKIGSMSEVFEERVRQSVKEQKEMGNDQLTATFYKCK